MSDRIGLAQRADLASDMGEQMPHPSTMPVERLLDDCDVERLRRSGPGGQHRNKVETAVRLTHRPTGVTTIAGERRSQAANLSQAVKRLRIKLALEVRARRTETPSDLWTSRCRGGKILVNPQNADFPALLAEALDTLQESTWDLTEAADRLGCTKSQLLKLLRGDPGGIAELNRQRQARRLRPIR